MESIRKIWEIIKSKFSLTTSEMIEEDNREYFIKTVADEILLIISFIFLMSFITLGMTSSSMFFLSRSLQKYFLETKFENYAGDPITFNEVKTAAEFWRYSEVVLANGLTSQFWYHNEDPIRPTGYVDSQILYQSHLVVGRVRQLKVRNNSCPIHDYMVRNFHVCYAAFSKNAEDKANFGVRRGKAWTYNTPKQAPAVPYYGIVNVYPSGGYYRILKDSAAGSAIYNLRENLWLTKGTRIIIYELAIYNGNVNRFIVVKLAFEFPPTGGVLPSSSFTTVHLFRYSTVLGIFVLLAELIYLPIVAFLISQEMNEMRFFGTRYFENFWNWVDLTIIALSIAAFCLRIYRDIWLFFVLRQTSGYANFEGVVDLQVRTDYLYTFILVFFIIKLFKYLEYSPVLGQLNLTLKKCLKSITGFAIMFFVVFLAYAELGYLLFGTQVIAFCGFYASMITLTRTILGDFDYEQIEASDSLYAPIYFLSYIFVVFFVLMNMFIAIVSDAYADVKVRKTVLEHTTREELYTLGVYEFLKTVHLSMLIPQTEQSSDKIMMRIREIETVLTNCGFDKEDIDEVLAECGYKPGQKSKYVNVYNLVRNIDRKQYTVPPMPRLPEKFSAVRDKSSLISYDEFLQAEEVIKIIQGILMHLTAKLDSLLNQFPQCL